MNLQSYRYVNEAGSVRHLKRALGCILALLSTRSHLPWEAICIVVTRAVTRRKATAESSLRGQ